LIPWFRYSLILLTRSFWIWSKE